MEREEEEEYSEEDIYEMALEVLEADEAFRLESSGSVSPESDVDRLLENADTERYSGDATLLRIFSILQNDDDNDDDAFRATINSVERLAEVEEMTRLHPASEILLSAAQDGSREYGRRDGVVWTTRKEEDPPGKVRSEPSIRGFRFSELCRAFDSVDLLSVDLTNESDSVGSGVPLRSKEARIRTHASRDRNDDAFGDETDSDVSLHVTSSDSLYSTTEDCFADDSVLVDLKSRCFGVGTWNTYTTTSSDDFSASAFRQPSPEDLFDEALETRSDLAASVGSSSGGAHRVSPPPYAYFDAVECSSACGGHPRGPSPEDEFELALETLSDTVDDSSSSVFFVVASPRSPRSDPRCRQRASDPLPANGVIETDLTMENDDLDFRRLDGSSRRSSCEAVADNDDDPSHPGRCPPSVPADPLTALNDLILGRQESKDCSYLDPWSSSMSSSSADCPCSSPEPSYLAEYSTDDDDDYRNGGESDSLTDDNDGASSGIEESTTRTSFFRRLLRRKEFREAIDLWGGGGTDLLDDIRICSIEDLLTDSENERDFRKVRSAAAPPPIDDRSPVFPASHPGGGVGRGQDLWKKVSEECHRAVDVPVSSSPPIVLGARADVQFARNNKIPKLPESTPPVRVSW